MSAKVYPSPASQDYADLHDYARTPRAVRPASSRSAARSAIGHTWDLNISDDWPDRILVSDAELDVFEAHFGALLDELFRSDS